MLSGNEAIVGLVYFNDHDLSFQTAGPWRWYAHSSHYFSPVNIAGSAKSF